MKRELFAHKKYLVDKQNLKVTKQHAVLRPLEHLLILYNHSGMPHAHKKYETVPGFHASKQPKDLADTFICPEGPVGTES